MTDLTPNDLSHLSDEEFNALCPQGEHAPGAEPLSPQAQAVLDAFLNGYIAAPKSGVAFCDDRNGLAAALRAAALYSYCPVDRRILMTIADELENHQ